jgi:predicted ATPase
MNFASYDILEELVRDGPHVVYRARRKGDHRRVLLKLPATPSDRPGIEALEREFELGSRLAGLGMPRAYELVREPAGTCLVLEDSGLVPLRRLLAGGAINLPSFFPTAIRLCAILGELHRRNVTHGAIGADSVLVGDDRSHVQLLNVGALATPRVEPGKRRPTVAAAYVSPEQTGRMNRAVDYRTDFYSLGATFYEMLTGAPPFSFDDWLEAIHAHIARTPAPPAQVDPQIPEQLSRLVMKLLAKAADDRYQSAMGVHHDLERCEEEWASREAITAFDLAQQDVPDRFVISQKLYGREPELRELLRAFDATCEGQSALMLVAGYPGIGKTSLIQELYKPIVRQRGYFIAGKFDQVLRNIPYGAVAQALRSLVWQLLTESEDRLADWRARLTAALGANGGVLAEVIPEIELIIGKQQPPQPLEPTEARNRFRYVFQSFVGTLARKEHPLVLFLDDLQWVDAATLELLHALVTTPDIRHLLLIGAYRDNEVDAAHLLTWAVERLQTSGAPVSRLWLAPLAVPDLTRLLCDTLRGDPGYVRPLATLIRKKTDGNPFFVIQFLKTLDQEGLFAFDRAHARWSFDIGAVAGAGMTVNVVDLMTRKICRLSAESQRVLTLAACVGNPFDRDALVTVSAHSPEEVSRGLAEAVDAGLIQPAGDPAPAGEDGTARRVTYAFLHDRVQQAAYALVPEAQRCPLHLEVGRLLLVGVDPRAADDRLFAIVAHLNIGSRLITDVEERMALVRLNLAAGRKAKTSAAYGAAVHYLVNGISLLDETNCRSDYDLMFSLHLEAAECQYLAGAFDRAEDACRLLLERSMSPLDRAQVHSLRITLYENQSRYAEAVSAGRDALVLFDISFPGPMHEKQAALDREVEGVQALLGARPIASLVDLPEMSDASMRMVMRLLTLLWAPAYLCGDEVLARLISATLVRLSLVHGNTEDSAYGYVTHAITIGPIRKEYRTAYEWGELALKVNRRFGDVKRRAKIHQQFQAHVNLWCRPFDTCIPHAREACRSGLEAGDFTYAGYGAATEAWSALLVARDLDRFVRDYTPTRALLDKIKLTDFSAAHGILLNWALALLGRTASPLSLSDATLDEEEFIRRYEDSAPFFLTFVYVARLHLCVLHERYDEALVAARRAREVAVTGTVWPVLVEFWGGLAAAGACNAAVGATREAHLAQLASAREALRALDDLCPENFRCFFLLLCADMARLMAQHESAAAFCEEAIAFARHTANLQQQALANEMCGRLWLASGDVARAQSFLRAAYSCYADWGASAKLAQLGHRYGHLLVAARPAGAAAETGIAASAVVDQPADIDMSTVLKVAHAIAVELEVGGLLRQLMKLALENAGAQRGMFLQERAGGLVVEAEAVADAGAVRVGGLHPLAETPNVAASVVRYVHRTGQNVVTGHAANDERFAADPYVGRSGAKSILCVPVGRQGRLGGILYLENHLTTDAFTPDRIEMMRILAAQTAISLENARLYEDMKAEVARRTTAEQALREALAEVEALKNRLEAENVYLQEEIRTQHNFNEIVGNSPALLEALRKVERVAPTESTVLIVGETGSGKELFARAVHSRSRRSDRPLVKVNCGAIAPGLVESELFGHVKGAFTGAIEKRIGRFELANGGTIFLDEIGELPLDAQVKLLRVLQEQEFEPVGSSRTVRVSVRVIAATNRNLEQAVADGRFRPDLLYRLNVFPIEVPPLRQRKPDLGLLVSFFSAALTRKLGKPIQGFSARSMERMARYSWPGNVRELQNIVERAAILARGPILDIEGTLLGGVPPPPEADVVNEIVALAEHRGSLEDVQRLHILNVLKSTGGVVEGARGAATILGLHPNTLRSRMKKLGISPAIRGNS